MKQRGAWFDALMDAADLYLDAMAYAAHDDHRKAARGRLLDFIKDGREARKRDVGLLEAKRARAAESQLRQDKLHVSRTLAEVYATEVYATEERPRG